MIDAVAHQAAAKEPLCAFLSGGLDSSLVSAVCVSLAEEKGQRLDTFSFDFTDNGKYFKANAFQPSQDHPYVEQMADFLNSQHPVSYTHLDVYKRQIGNSAGTLSYRNSHSGCYTGRDCDQHSRRNDLRTGPDAGRRKGRPSWMPYVVSGDRA